MDKLMTQQELTALASLLSRVPMTPPEQMWAQALVQRLVAYCAPAPGTGGDDQAEPAD